MKSCERCGEDNSADADFCGNCGSKIVQAGSVASLIDDSDDATRPGAGASAAADLQSSEWVAPPSYGETVAGGAGEVPPVAPPSTGDTTTTEAAAAEATRVTPVVSVGPPPTDPYAPVGAGPFASPVVSGNSRRTTNIMVAALAVAVVVIVGGIVLLLSMGGEGDEFARSGADPTTQPETQSDPSAPDADEQVVEPVVTDSVTTVVTTDTVPEIAPVESAPTDSVAGVEPPVEDPDAEVEPSTPSTAPATTSATTTTPAPEPPPSTEPPPPPSTLPPRAPGDLALAQPILDWPCTGDYITFVRGIVGGDRPTGEQVENGLRDFPDAGYLWGGICPSIRTSNDAGDEIYGIVYGPFATASEACSVAEDFSSEGAYVRRFTEFQSDIGREVCGG